LEVLGNELNLLCEVSQAVRDRRGLDVSIGEVRGLGDGVFGDSDEPGGV
jgi:hypothetical protein